MAGYPRECLAWTKWPPESRPPRDWCDQSRANNSCRCAPGALRSRTSPPGTKVHSLRSQNGKFRLQWGHFERLVLVLEWYLTRLEAPSHCHGRQQNWWSGCAWKRGKKVTISRGKILESPVDFWNDAWVSWLSLHWLKRRLHMEPLVFFTSI